LEYTKKGTVTKDPLNQLISIIRAQKSADRTYDTAIFSAYAILTAKKASPAVKPVFADMLELIKENELVRSAVAAAVGDLWDEFDEVYNACEIDALCKYIIKPGVPKHTYDSSTPSSVSTLAIELLNVKNTNNLADLGTGNGEFIVNAYQSNANANYFGVETNPELAAIAMIRAEMLGKNVKIEQRDMFSLWSEPQRYSKIFSDYPFCQKNLHVGLEFVDACMNNKITPSLGGSSDWLYNFLLSECIDDGGKAIGIMTQGACFNRIDKKMRQYFVENGLIEAVIALPPKMHAETAISLVLIIISKGNSSIRFIDAANLYKRGRRLNEFEPGHINSIMDALRTNSEISCELRPDEIATDDYNLSPQKKLSKPIEFKYGMTFGDVITRITRGAQIPANEIDRMIADEPTAYQYMMVGDIQDGMINEDLSFLKSIEPRLEKYCAAPGSLLLSKNGEPFKVGVVDDTVKTKLLATGNLYIIDLDRSRINPIYLKAFFESEIGTRLLRNSAAGTTLPVLQLDVLKSLTIPCPPLEEQTRIAEKYTKNQNLIKNLKSQITAALEESKSFFSQHEGLNL